MRNKKNLELQAGASQNHVLHCVQRRKEKMEMLLEKSVKDVLKDDLLAAVALPRKLAITSGLTVGVTYKNGLKVVASSFFGLRG